MTPSGQPTGAGARLVDALRRLEDHGFDPQRFSRDRILELSAPSVAAEPTSREGAPAPEPPGAIPLPDAARADELDSLLRSAFDELIRSLTPNASHSADQLAAALERARGSAVGMASELRRYLPPQRRYAEMVKALRHYRRAMETGQVGAVPKGKRLPRPGKRSAVIPPLKRRLEVMGFFRGSQPGAEDLYDGPLREAIGHFQYGCGLEATGTLNRATARALAVGLDERARQLVATLDGIRRSKTRELDGYLLVNIPEYRAHLYEGGRRVRSFRVVVGRPETTHDPVKDRRGPLNRTPLLTGSIDRVVLNPVWRVPARIRATELEPQARKDPSFWERNGYLVRGGSVVQLPGPGNALGRVKFLFDNPHGVYLHDTPLRHLFKRPRRAFSHGCVRISEPMVLARYLLEREGHVAATRVDGLLRGSRETQLELTQPLTIVIEYELAGVDGEGRAVFWEDVYRRGY